MIISSAAGRIFATQNQGITWHSIGEPGALDGSYADALTFGAPDPSAPGGIGNLNNFIYAGTVGGNIFVSQTGGGGGVNGAWTNISTGLDGSSVVKIIADPTRASHDAYAVTQLGVYYLADSIPSLANPTPTWTNVTGNLFSLTTAPFGQANAAQPSLAYLTSIQADWRYVIPFPKTTGTGTGTTTTGPTTHPILYVGGQGGVFRSLDNGTTWAPFPNQAIDGSPVDGGYLPNVAVTDLDTALGAIDPTTGFAESEPNDPDLLLATTFGQGQFAIRLAPIVIPTTLSLDTKLPAPAGSVNGTVNGLPLVKVAQPVIDGLSEISAFGNTVFVTIYDLTNPNNPIVIGGFDPSQGPISSNPTAIAANETSARRAPSRCRSLPPGLPPTAPRRSASRPPTRPGRQATSPP